MKQRIAVLGMGELGSSLVPLLRKNKHVVDCWDKQSGKVRGQRTLFELVPKADIIFLCVPSWSIPSVMKSIGPFLRKNTTLVGFSKGLQPNGDTTAEYLSRVAGTRNAVVIVGGAMLANEISAGAPGFGIVASRSSTARKKIAELFDNSNIRITTDGDVRGVEVCGVLKNIYALGLGITEGLGWGDNGKAWLAVQITGEMERLVKDLGGKSETFYSASGIVDLIATGFSEYSQNMQSGILVVKKKRCISSSESAVSFAPLFKIMKKDVARYPILKVIYRSATCKEDPRKAFARLLK